MENQPKVSVIIPVYNVESYIARCATSLFNQTLDSIEYIFVDDCTPDKSIDVLKEIIEHFPHRRSQIHILSHPFNKGLGATRYTGLMASTGEYIIHCDSDDWVEHEMYEKMYCIAKETNCDLVGCGYYGEYNRVSKVYKESFPEDPKAYLRYLLDGNLHNAVWNKLIKRNIYFDNQVFPIDGFNMWEDAVLILRLVYYCKKVVYIPSIFYHYRFINQNSYTGNCSVKSMQNILDIVDFLDDFFSENDKKNIYKDNLLLFRLRAKAFLIIRGNKDYKLDYATLYPETNPYLFKYSMLRMDEKLIIWLYNNRFNKIGNGMLNLINRIKKIRKRLI